jgi:hypothetical protein
MAPRPVVEAPRPIGRSVEAFPRFRIQAGRRGPQAGRSIGRGPFLDPALWGARAWPPGRSSRPPGRSVDRSRHFPDSGSRPVVEAPRPIGRSVEAFPRFRIQAGRRGPQADRSIGRGPFLDPALWGARAWPPGRSSRPPGRSVDRSRHFPDSGFRPVVEAPRPVLKQPGAAVPWPQVAGIGRQEAPERTRDGRGTDAFTMS